jgi:hypothetical protein
MDGWPRRQFVLQPSSFTQLPAGSSGLHHYHRFLNYALSSCCLTSQLFRQHASMDCCLYAIRLSASPNLGAARRRSWRCAGSRLARAGRRRAGLAGFNLRNSYHAFGAFFFVFSPLVGIIFGIRSPVPQRRSYYLSMLHFNEVQGRNGSSRYPRLD